VLHQTVRQKTAGGRGNDLGYGKSEYRCISNGQSAANSCGFSFHHDES